MKIKFLQAFKSVLFWPFLITLLLLGTFWRLFRFGIFSMNDFHIFRLYEFEKCIKDLQIPCRWAVDSGLGYGEPLFNFYAQLPYFFGEIPRLLGFSIIDSTKILFALSIILSSIGMFYLAKQLWKDNLSALICALIYAYAPYRAVDIYVRGALPEALGFIFFPLIIYFLTSYLQAKKETSLLWFSLFLSGLVLTHNLSVVMFLPFLVLWGVYLIYKNNSWKLIPKLALSMVLVFGLSAFYLLPVIFEAKFVTIQKTTQGIYDFRAQFVTLYQLLFSRHWGYGASSWGNNDDVSLSVGQIQWILPMIVLLTLIVTRKIKRNYDFIVLFLIGWFFLFLAHNKSTFIWLSLPFLSYIQFPWRFLSLAVFSFSLSSGSVFVLIKNSKAKLLIASLLIILLIGLNTDFFFEDLWFKVGDNQFFSGDSYRLQTLSAINDFWPVFAKKIPNDFPDNKLIFIEGTGSSKLVSKKSNYEEFSVNLESKTAKVQFPIAYFPGWQVYSNNQKIMTSSSGDLGVITADLSQSDSIIKAKFENTPIRTIGNTISIITLTCVCWLLIRKKNYV